ncbi:MAG: PhzF family phenazine biosynthesis protein [Anaerolineales bacterium]
MTHKLFQLDAFTSEPFRGNPAAVCLLAGPESKDWMQALATEMNLSETAFLLPENGGWRLRWFTPTMEVDLCGHATLASAMVLFEIHPSLRTQSLNFHTRSGDLRACWMGEAVELDFPAMPLQTLAINPKWIDILGFEPIDGVFSGDYYLFEATNSEFIRAAKPVMSDLMRLPMPEIIITAKSDVPAYDFISRFFAPQLGVAEDPVTGSAHCLLTPYWAKKLGKLELNAYQASARGGELHLHLVEERVHITGAAKFIFEADLLV